MNFHRVHLMESTSLDVNIEVPIVNVLEKVLAWDTMSPYANNSHSIKYIRPTCGIHTQIHMQYRSAIELEKSHSIGPLD